MPSLAELQRSQGLEGFLCLQERSLRVGGLGDVIHGGKMRSLSSLGVGLSLVFICLFMALVAEVYFWWKKRTTSHDMEGGDDTGSPGELYMCCCWRKKPSVLSSRGLISQELSRTTEEGEDAQQQALPGGEDGVDAELMGLYDLAGPARLLFTIKEETKEDLESEDGKSRGDESRRGSRRKMGDWLLGGAETPFFTPLSSPPFFTPPLTPMGCRSPHGFSPLSEQSQEGDRRRVGLGSSPPPKFKFLKDAEEKLYRKTLMEEAMRVNRRGALAEEAPSSLASAAARVGSPSSTMGSEEEDGSFITIVVGRSQERSRHQHHSSSSQVIPLPSSPSDVRGAAQQGKTRLP